ncbi:MAG TPA: family 43 glycosylhydrolase [Gemmatimonadaceae bacterium]|nr:family 43 glycosylhydrolase [Gemmatimonadaceae bacterium]
MNRLWLGLLLLVPALRAHAEPGAARPLHLVLVGDSTVNDRSGWGTGFRHWVPEDVVLTNTAQNGRSSKSFRAEGHWAKALALRGDYYLIQFGHNDQPGKGPDRETDPDTTYAANLARFVDEVRAIGATPVLVTSLTRRDFSKTAPGRIASTLTPYVEAVKRIAAEKGVPLIDMHARSIAYCEALGPAETARLNPKKPDGTPDTTHLEGRGSDAFARIVVEELRRVVPALDAVLLRAPRPVTLTDLEYGQAAGEKLLLDASVPAGDGPFPVAILIHGGGWSRGDKRSVPVGDSADIAPWFAPLTAGQFAWFSINYRLAPKHRWPACLEDVETAIRWVKAHAAEFKGDPDRIALIGHSAGGHLAAFAGTVVDDRARVQAVVGYAPVTNHEQELPVRGGVSTSLQALLNRPKEITPESLGLLRTISPLNHVRPGLPAYLLIHGDADKTVPIQQSYDFRAKLQENGVPCELLVIPGGVHALAKWGELAPDYPARMIAWLRTTLDAAAGRGAWNADQGDGTYRNPILHADYSDPDAVRVGDDYWLVASSFNHAPGLPLLHSRDLVNWQLAGHALPRLVPEAAFAAPRHGQGVWAPAIRHHAGKFWIYYPDPDFGLYVTTAENPRGPWSAPVLVKAGKGLIDPCPLWDDDGRVYLVHAWAKSRSGINNKLTLLRLSADGLRAEEDLGFVIDGDKLPGYSTLEGPKLYKRNGWYYVFAPAGGVTAGWQSVFRARDIRGPYEDRIVLAQGGTSVNGPHQGALVDTPNGEWWFLHFQDQGAYGRVVHLQPVSWRDDWPAIGTAAASGAPKGEPVPSHAKPALPPQPRAVPATGDNFDTLALGAQWQWQANPGERWCSLADRPGSLRLFAQPAPAGANLYDAPNLLLQKFPAREFTATTRLEFDPRADGDRAGLIVFGYDYAWLGWRQQAGRRVLSLAVCRDAVKGAVEQVETAVAADGPVWLRVTVRAGELCRFAFSTDGRAFTDLGGEFRASVGRWVGAKVGLFATGAAGAHADFDVFAVEPLRP